MTSKKKTLIASIISFVLVISIVSGSGIMIINAINKKDAEKGDALNAVTKIEGKTVNFLLLGTDESRRRTDTMMIFSLNTEENTLTLTSMPRDTKIQIKNRPQKLNASIPYGSLSLLIQNIKAMTGIPIHHYALVDFEGFRNIIDILGGVEFDVPMRMKYDDPAQDLHIDLQKGVQILDGDKAEQLVRFRHGYAMGDHKRIEVQREFMIALMQQKLKPEYLTKAVGIFKEISEFTETNITVADIMGYLSTIKNLKTEDIRNVKFPGEAKYIGNISYFVADIDAVKEEFCELFGGNPEDVDEDVYGYSSRDYKSESETKNDSSSSNKNTSSTSNKNNTDKNSSSSSSDKNSNNTDKNTSTDKNNDSVNDTPNNDSDKNNTDNKDPDNNSGNNTDNKDPDNNSGNNTDNKDPDNNSDNDTDNTGNNQGNTDDSEDNNSTDNPNHNTTLE